MIKFVGDLSAEDASVLAEFAYGNSVLEFGSGGSTQIFAQVADSVTSVETDPTWVEKTRKNVLCLDDPKPVEFVPYDLFKFDQPYGVIFVDGVPNKRLQFAENAWKCLDGGGFMIFHDTRRFEYFKEAAWIIQLFFAEIQRVEVNYRDSNMTVIRKRGEPLHYVNWNETEGKPLWAYGAAERPDGEGLWQQEI